MAIRTACDHCHTPYNVPDEQLGRSVRCKQCQQVFTVAAQAVDGDPGAPGRHPAPVPTVAAEPASAPPPPRRPLRRRPVAVEKETSSAASLILALVVVFGTLAILVAAGFVAYFFLKTDYEKLPAAVHPNPKDFDPLGKFRPGPAGPFDEDDKSGTGSEQIGFEPKQFDKPDAGPKTFFPAAPIPKLADGDQPGPTIAADGTLNQAVLTRVKAATAFLRVTTSDGTPAEGSGFFCVEPGIVVTNCHVIGMMHPATPKPRQIDVVISSGEKDERTLQGTILGIDRVADLAVLRVQGKDLPEPLRVETSLTLQETMPVFVSGFPGGSQRGRNVSITPTRVDSLLKENGVLDRVQVRGAMLPGNSGGPVVNARGDVIGVSVAMFRPAGMGDTSVCFAVPSDKVHHLLNGRVSEMTIGYPHAQADDAKVSARLQLFDPRKRVKRMALEWWIGDSGPDRQPSWTQPEKRTGDSARTQVDFKTSAGALEAELVLKPLPAGKVYWLQPVLFSDLADRTQWASAVAYEPPPALQNIPADLAHKAAPETTVELTTRSMLSLRGDEGQSTLLAVNIGSKLREPERGLEAEPPNPRHFAEFDLGVRFHGYVPTRNILRRLLSSRTRTKPPDLGDARFSQIPEKSRREAALLVDSIQGLIDGLDVARPMQPVQPLESWTEQRTIPVDSLFDQRPLQQFKIKYTYLGTRQQDDRRSAVIQFAGDAVKGEERLARGRITGTAWLDLATGQVTLVRAEILYDVEGIIFMNEGASAGGKMEVRLVRNTK